MWTSNHNKIADHFAGQFRTALLNDIRSIESSLQTGNSASFTTTIQMKQTKDGELVAVLKPRTRVPGVELHTKLILSADGQLELFGSE